MEIFLSYWFNTESKKPWLIKADSFTRQSLGYNRSGFQVKVYTKILKIIYYEKLFLIKIKS